MQLRIGSVLAVPVERDEVEIGQIEALSLGRLSLSSVTLSPLVLDRVQVRVGGRWYELWECGCVDSYLNLISLRELLEDEFQRIEITN